MNNLLTHYPVNWIDGMKLSSSHFIAVQDFVTDSLRDAIALQTTDLNYGLQPVEGDAVKMHVLMDHYNQLQLTLEECHAVTPNGIRIQISASQEGQTLTLSKDMTEMKGNASFSVFITAELFKPIPYGEAAAQEYPPRIPFLRPTYSLYLYTDEELKNKDLGDGYLMIGRVIMDNGQVRLDDTYIPPCSCVIAHPSLQTLYHRIRSFYAKMENYAIQISQKIHIKKQNNELSAMIDKIDERMLVFLGQEINRFELLSPYNPPCELLLSVTAFARIVKNFTDAHSGAGKMDDIVLKWCEKNEFKLSLTHEPSILLWGIKTSIDEIESFSNKIIETKGIKNVNISKINDIVNNIKFLKNMELNADEYFSEKIETTFIIYSK